MCGGCQGAVGHAGHKLPKLSNCSLISCLSLLQMLGYVATRFSDKEDMSPMSRSRGVSLSSNAKLTRPMSPFISASAKPISPPQNSVMPSAPTSSASAGSGLGSLLGRPKLQ